MTYRGKVVVVIGAGEGLGGIIARQYAAQGAKLVVVDINENLARETVEDICERKGCGIFLQADVGSVLEVRKLMRQIVEYYGRIDILINCIGPEVINHVDCLSQSEGADLEHYYLKSVLACSKEAIKIMKKTKTGAIVHVITPRLRFVQGTNVSFQRVRKMIVNMVYHLAISTKMSDVKINCISSKCVENHQYERLSSSVKNTGGLCKNVREDIALACLSVTRDTTEYLNGTNIEIDRKFIRKMVYMNK